MYRSIIITAMLLPFVAVSQNTAELFYYLPSYTNITLPEGIPEIQVKKRTAGTFDAQHYIMSTFNFIPDELDWVFIYSLDEQLKNSPNFAIPTYARSSVDQGIWIFEHNQATGLYTFNQFQEKEFLMETLTIDEDFNVLPDTMKSLEAHVMALPLSENTYLSSGYTVDLVDSVGIQTIDIREYGTHNIVERWSPLDSVFGIPNIEARSYLNKMRLVPSLGDNMKDIGHQNGYTILFGDSDTSFILSHRHLGLIHVGRNANGILAFRGMIHGSDVNEKYDDWTWFGDSVSINSQHAPIALDAYGDTVEVLVWNNNNLGTPRNSEIVLLKMILSKKEIYAKKRRLSSSVAMGNTTLLLRDGEVMGNVNVFDDFNNRQFTFNHGIGGTPLFDVDGDAVSNGIIQGNDILFAVSFGEQSSRANYQTSTSNIPSLDELRPLISCVPLDDKGKVRLYVEDSIAYASPLEANWVTGSKGFSMETTLKPDSATVYFNWVRKPGMQAEEYIFGVYYHDPNNSCARTTSLANTSRSSVQFFPNPAVVNTSITLSGLTQAEFENLEVYNSLGQLVKHSVTQGGTLNIHSSAVGIYQINGASFHTQLVMVKAE